MGKILISIVLLTGSLSYADSITDSHWTLKTIQCQGGSPSPTPSGLRYDWHFLAKSRVEIAILRPHDWVIGKGHYVLGGGTNLCLYVDETLQSGGTSNSGNESWCGDYEIAGDILKFTWVVTSPGGGDCPQDVPATVVFQKM